MEEWRRGRSGPSGRSKAFERAPSSFEVSEDGTQFSFPTWPNAPKDPSLISRYNASLKWVGGYSEDEEKKFCNDKTEMNFMNMQYYPSQSSRKLKVDLNLHVGENVERYTGSKKQAFENLLTWILKNEQVFTQKLSLDKKSHRKGGKFVAARNVLSEIGITYNNKKENSFLASCYDGVIYLLQNETQKTVEKELLIHDWAHAFEHLITHNQQDKKKVICNTDYRIVISSCLGEHRMILSCATDCFNPDKYKEEMEDTSALIGLKCCYHNPDNKKTKQLERFKMFNWSLGLYFSGIPELVVGYRNCRGFVEILKLYNKSDLMEKGQGYWDMECVFLFLQHLLSFVKNRTTSKPGKIFNFFKKEYSQIYTCSEEVKEVIPEWFRKEYKTSDEVPRG